MRERTDAEMKAYVDGYNAANKQFRECLKNRKSLIDAIRKMDAFVMAVNSVIAEGEQNANNRL